MSTSKSIDNQPFVKSGIYRNPGSSFLKAMEELGLTDRAIREYLEMMFDSRGDRRSDAHQERIKPILERLLATGEKEKAGLLFNIHRILTEFAGYGANENASSDVDACFSRENKIPSKGVIVVDFFATRNLPKIIKILEERGIDLARVRINAPRAVLALQMALMSDEKRDEFDSACAKLAQGQFRADSVYHVDDIPTDEPVAIWFSPRTMPIHPRLHAETEAETLDNYIKAFRMRVAKVVPGGRIYANLAFSENWQPLGVERESKRRILTKLTGISRGVAEKVVGALLVDGFFPAAGLKVNEFRPFDRNPGIDHGKLAQELHLRKQ